jgi:putative FmdB family regulatory protein
MPILVDYRCTGCGVRQEAWEPSPPAATRSCVACGGEARRQFAAIGLSGRSTTDTRGAAETTGSTPAAPREPTLCQQYPQIPGLCHMTPSAQRRWVATYTRDTRAQEREIAHQESTAKEQAPVLSDAISHTHQHAH